MTRTCFCRNPFVTGTSVFGLTFKGGVMIASDTLGTGSNAKKASALVGHCQTPSNFMLTCLRYRLLWLHKEIQVL